MFFDKFGQCRGDLPEGRRVMRALHFPSIRWGSRGEPSEGRREGGTEKDGSLAAGQIGA